MTVPTPDESPSAADDVEDAERYAELETEETFILYDRENHRAWLESDGAVAVEAMQ